MRSLGLFFLLLVTGSVAFADAYEIRDYMRKYEELAQSSSEEQDEAEGEEEPTESGAHFVSIVLKGAGTLQSAKKTPKALDGALHSWALAVSREQLYAGCVVFWSNRLVKPDEGFLGKLMSFLELQLKGPTRYRVALLFDDIEAEELRVLQQREGDKPKLVPFNKSGWSFLYGRCYQ